MRKLLYILLAAVALTLVMGCGRSVDKCPQSLNIIKVIKAFEKAEKGGAV